MDKTFINILRHCLVIVIYLQLSGVSNAQSQFQPTDLRVAAINIALILDGMLVIRASKDTIYRSPDGGNTWFITHWVAFSGAVFEKVSRPSHVLAKGKVAKKLKGEIGPFVVGYDNTWNPKAWRFEDPNWIEISIAGSGRLFAAAIHEQTVVFVGEGGSWRSTDGGINFQPGVGLFGGVEVVYNHIDSKWYAATGPGIQTSVDGLTWGPPGEFVIVNKIAVHPTIGNMALATAFSEVKVLTIGGTLTTLSNGWPTNAFPSGVCYDAQGTLYASYIIYGSPNISSTMKYNESANQWEDIGGVPNADINDIEYAEFDTESSITASLFAATTDGVWGMDLATGVEGELTNPNDFILHQNYPNPFNPTTNIEFQIADFGFVSLKVYDILGNEVATLTNEFKPAGNYQVEFNAGDLTSGVYFYTLNTEGFIQTKKLLLMK
jgi:hypothetical protein